MHVKSPDANLGPPDPKAKCRCLVVYIWPRFLDYDPWLRDQDVPGSSPERTQGWRE